VNGYKVLDNDGEYVEVEQEVWDGDSIKYREYSQEEIKSIVTHQQMAQIEYKVEEDK
jgi:hypothetical protein